MKYIIILIAILFYGCSSINKKDSSGQTALMKASGLGNYIATKALIEQGADVNQLDNKMGVSALHRAAQSGNVKIIKLLLKSGAFIDDQSAVNGHTPLLDAAFYKRYDAIRYLLKVGANPNLKNTLGLNVWDWGKRQKDPKIIKLLKNQKRLDEILEKKQKLMAAAKDNNVSLVKKLLIAGANPNAIAKDGNTPLLWVSKYGYVEIARLLLEHGANPNIKDRLMKATPGHKAAFFGHAKILKLLAKHGLNLDAQGPYNGYTALDDSLLNSHIEASKVLVNAGANLNIEGIDGKTPRKIAKDLNILKETWN